MFESWHKFLRCVFISLLSLLVVVGSAEANASGYVPQSLSGDVSYGYGYVQTTSAASESSSISTSFDLDAYIWQPWFITHSLGFSIGLSRTASEGGGTSQSQFVTGRTGLEIFPRSRVPISLSFSKGDSQSDVADSTSTFTVNEFSNKRYMARIMYIGRENLFGNLIASRIETDSKNNNDSSDNINLNLSKRVPGHVFNSNLGYSTNKSDGSDSKPERYTLTASHGYVPGTSVSVSTSVNYNESTVSSSIADANSNSNGVQLASFFSWRPEYKPLSLTGGVRVAGSDSKSGDDPVQESRDVGVSMGMSYRLSSKIQVIGAVSLNLSDDDGVQATTTSENVSASYSSDQYVIIGYNYGWSLNGALSDSAAETSAVNGNTTSDSEQVASLSFSHRANRFWNIGRASSFDLGFAQGGSKFKSFASDGESSHNIGHSANLGLTTRGLRGSTRVSLSLNDSRTFGEKDSNFQQVGLSLGKNHVINRLSTVNGDATYQTSTQRASDAPTVKFANARAGLRYQHNRLFGVYGMIYNSSLSFYQPINDVQSSPETSEWSNKVDYRIGLLATSLNVDVTKNGGVDPTIRVFFRATRTF